MNKQIDKHREILHRERLEIDSKRCRDRETQNIKVQTKGYRGTQRDRDRKAGRQTDR
jgi:hypothetical protein